MHKHNITRKKLHNNCTTVPPNGRTVVLFAFLVSASGAGVDDLMEVLSIGRNTAYELIRSGKIHSVRIGTNYRIPWDAQEEYLTKR